MMTPRCSKCGHRLDVMEGNPCIDCRGREAAERLEETRRTPLSDAERREMLTMRDLTTPKGKLMVERSML